MAGCKLEIIVDSIAGAYLAELREEELHAEESLSGDALADELVTEASAELEARFGLGPRAELREARNEHVTPRRPRATRCDVSGTPTSASQLSEVSHG